KQLLRIALVLAEAEQAASGGAVTAALIERAAAIVNFVMDCWRALPERETLALTRSDEKLDGAIARLIPWLEQHGGGATRRELQKAHVAGARTAHELDALLARYSASYPGAIEWDEDGRTVRRALAPTRRASP